MLSLKANGQKKTLKDEFVDVTLNELAAAYKYVTGLDSETKRYLLNDGETVNDDKLFEFKIHWISLFSDFSIEDLRLVPLEDSEQNSLSVDWLYSYCKAFLKQPESYVTLKEFNHKGVDYHLIKPLKTIGGVEMLFGKANYRQFMLGSQLASMVEKNKTEASIGSLTQLFALLYSDGNDSSEDIVNRANLFGNVNALYGWSAYFFFVELVKRYKDYFLLSTTKNPPQRVKTALARQQLKALLLRTTFGKLLLSKWLNKEFLILEL
jgi:hypothetical protein